jgi:hypothetical protein
MFIEAAFRFADLIFCTRFGLRVSKLLRRFVSHFDIWISDLFTVILKKEVKP